MYGLASEPVKRRLIGSQILKPYYGGSEEFDVDPLEKFRDEAFKKTYVHWLTEPGNQEEQVTYMAVSVPISIPDHLFLFKLKSLSGLTSV